MNAKLPEENPEFLTTQIITYLGNKRTLIKNIEAEVFEIEALLKNGQKKITTLDLFSGSGIVARMLKRHSKHLIANDLEEYSRLLNECYLTNKEDFPKEKYLSYKNTIEEKCHHKKNSGIIAKNFAPKNDDDIQKGERVFYTHKNALLIDTYRKLIDEIVAEEEMKKFFLAPLITETSIHVNTSGVFKGFYKDKNTGIGCFGAVGKNALTRIFGKIELKEPVLSNFSCKVDVFKSDACALASKLKNIDIAYLDPPYNQHPYGSNYFMLNLIIKNRLDVPLSKISGITQDWNRSVFNTPRLALAEMEKIISVLDAKFIIISYNSEGFITFDEMKSMLQKYGSLKTVEIKYNTFRGSRNLRERNIHVSEFLFVLKKGDSNNRATPRNARCKICNAPPPLV